ncbi:hypothetical protein ACJMK2_029190 [Sinanodonta woodiana]|uniref:RING-type domain-containing protein n=1 Tax=Sinanodonta woodiana TaxID=1069815 RepID=A0ABD3XBP4_SINWO
MEPSLSDEELQSGDHSTDLCAEKGKEINLVSRQNVDVEGTNSVNIDGEVVSSEFAHIVEGIPTEKNEDKTDARPVEKLICNDMESGAKVNDNKEDPSVNNEEYEGYKRAGLTSFGHMVSVDHNESKHQLVAIVEWYLSRICILWTLVVRSYLLNGQFMTTRLWGLMIAIEYQGRFFKYTVQKIVLEVLTYSTSSRGTILELNPDVPCELMPNFQQRGLKHHSWQKAVTKISGILDGTAFSKSQRREAAQGWKDCMTSVNELAFDGKTDIRKFYPDIHVFQYHHSQMEFTVCAVPRYDVIPVRESSNQPLSDTVDPTASLDDFMTDPQILDQFAFEMRVSRPSAFSPHSVIAQETDQHATHAYVFTMSQNESTRELCTRENNLPAPAFPASISSRSSEGPSQTTSSTFSPIPSADLLRQGDSSQTTDLCPNRSADHHNSNWLQKNNDTKEEVAPNETRSASVDDSLWDAPGTPDTININERGQTEVAALKESNAGETTKNQQKVSETKKEPSPIYLDYAEKTTRIATFKEWSPELKQPEEFADCGFYYTGVNDHVRCFHCGILLHEWKREDDPWIEHARHSPKCRHVRMMKGEKFISQAAMMTKERYHHSQMEFTVCAVPWYDVIPSADLLRQGDSSQTTDFCPNRSADHHSSNWLQKNNDTKEEVAPNETGSASVDDSQSLWDAPGTPDTININERGQTEVAALKESNAGETTKNQQKVSETKKEPSPIYLDYAEKTTRIATFKEWSPELKQPEEFADCGFYYTGVNDHVRCFHCGILLHEWKREDDPWIEHARHSPKCRHVRMMKGEKFISPAAMMTKEREAERNGGGNKAPENNEAATAVPLKEEVWLLAVQRSYGSNQSDTAQGESSLMLPSSEQNRRQNVSDNLPTVSAHVDSVLEPPPKYPQYAVKNMRINSFQGWPAELRQRPEEMAECGFYYAGFNDCVHCFFCGVELQQWMSEDDPWIEHARWSISCVYVLKMKGKEFVSLIKLATEVAEREEPTRNNSGGNHASQDRKKEAAPTVVIQEGHTTKGNTKSEQSQKDRQKMKRHRALRGATLCKFCRANTISVVFLPCGHFVTCPDCAPAMTKCPICGTLIEGRKQIFYQQEFV